MALDKLSLKTKVFPKLNTLGSSLVEISIGAYYPSSIVKTDLAKSFWLKGLRHSFNYKSNFSDFAFLAELQKSYRAFESQIPIR